MSKASVKIRQNKPSSDVVYEQLYNEMRRIRDYQMVITGWYSTLLVGIIAGLFGIQGLRIRIKSWGVLENLWLCAAVIFIALIGFSICYIIWYSHDRYKSLRTFTDIEFPDEKANIKTVPEWRKPHSALIMTNAILTVATIITLIVTTSDP